MKRNAAVLSLALAVMVPLGADAADWDRGGGRLKDYRSAVPVPAPMPIAETFRWYVRADIGLGLLDQSASSERGMIYGANDSIAPFGMSASWFSSDFDTSVVGGVGVGLYLTPRFRGDLTVDWRTASETHVAGAYAYPEYNPAAAAFTGNVIGGQTTEYTRINGPLGLVNLYWDILPRGGFTPYVGVGAGIAVRHTDRQHTTVETLYDTMGNPIGSRTFEGKRHSADVAPAAAATAGASWAVSPGMLLDFNYRFTYVGSVDNSLLLSNGTRTTVTVGETHEHALRAGIRWNVW